MEETREIAVRTYKEATANGLKDTAMHWHIWKRVFDIAETELKNKNCVHPLASLLFCNNGEVECKFCGYKTVPF